MYEVIHKGRSLFRSVSIERCNQFIARHNLKGAIIQPLSQMLAA
jgi:hypothetical protein